MASKKLYIGHIKYNNGVDIIPKIDMCNLPHDLFGDEFPLEFFTDVDMGKGNKAPLPDMANVWIHGTFDCSTFTILDNTVLPDKIVKLVCKHSLSDLGILIGKLPDTLQEIIVRPAVLNDIKNDDTKRDNAMRLAQMYPHINVTDGKKTLKSVLDEISIVKSVEPTAKAETAPSAIEPEHQPDDWYSVEDLKAACAGLVDSENLLKPLDRYIKQALSTKSGLNIETREFKRHTDNVVIKCVHKDAHANIIDYVTNAVRDDAARANKQKKAKLSASKTPRIDTSKPSTTTSQTYFVDNTEIVKIKIKKYISKSAWGQIQPRFGKNTNGLLKVLQDIEDINTNPALAHTASSQVVFIKDGAVHVSPTVTFKNIRCLAQGFGTLNDRPRIVWGVDGNIFVCQDFYASHEGKKGLMYNQKIDSINIDASKLDLKNDFLLVSDLIKELSIEKEERTAPTPVLVAASDITLDTNTEPTPIEVPTEPAQPDATTDTTTIPEPQTKHRKRARITKVAEPIIIHTHHYTTSNDTKNVTKKEYVAPIIGCTTQPVVPEKQPAINPNRKHKHRWASLYHLKGRLISQYNILTFKQQELLQTLSVAPDTDQMLQTTQRLQNILEQKKKVESAIKEVERKNQELHDFIQQIEEQIH